MNRRALLLDIFLGILLPLAVSYIALWKLFSTPGLVLYGDLGFPINLGNYLSSVFTSWNEIYSSPNNPISYIDVLHFAIPYWLGASPELAEKLWLFTSYALVGMGIYFSMRILLPKGGSKSAYLSACVAASLSYMINKYILVCIHLPNVLLSYATLPLVLAFYVKTLKNDEHLLKNSLLTAVFYSLTITFTATTVLLLPLMVFYWLYRTLENRDLVGELKKNALIVFFFILLNSYWIFPKVLTPLILAPQTSLMPAHLTQPMFNFEELELKMYGWGFDLLSVLALDIGFGLFLPKTLFSTSIGLLIPIMAFSALLLRKKSLKSLIIAHSVLYLVFSLFTIRSMPFVYVPSFFGKYIFSSGSWWRLVRNPSIFAPFLVYSLSFLYGAFVFGMIDWILKPVKEIVSAFPGSFKASLSRIIAIVVLFVLISSMMPWIAYSSYPASGDVDGHLRPIKIPEGYYKVNSLLINRGGSFKTWWLPQPYDHQRFKWAPDNPRPREWPPLFSSRPVIFRVHDPLIDYLYLQDVLGNKSHNLGKMLSPLSVKYVIACSDRFTQWVAKGHDESRLMMSALSAQNDLRLVNNDDLICLFENKAFDNNKSIYIPSKIALVVGGYSVYDSLSEMDTFNPINYSMVFSEQLSPQYLHRMLSFADVVFMADRERINELALQLAGDYFIYPEGGIAEPSGSWSKAWRPNIHYEGLKLGKYLIQDGDLTYGDFTIFSSKVGSSLNLPININKTNEYDIWIRTLKSPLGGKLSIYLDGHLIKSIETISPRVHYEWIKIIEGKVLHEGLHNVRIINLEGSNYINVLSVVPTNLLNNIRREVIDVLNDKEVYIVKRSLLSYERRVDQASTFNEKEGGWEAFGGNVFRGATFITRADNLAGVTLWIARKSEKAGNLIVELRSVKEGLPSTVLSSTVLSPKDVSWWGSKLYINLKHNLKSGEKYTIILREGGGNFKDYWVLRSDKNVYNEGSIVRSDDNGTTWREGNADLWFKTYYLSIKETDNLMESKYSNITIYDLHTLKEIHEFPIGHDPAKIVRYEKLSSSKYVITVKANKPFIIVIPENYDSYWQVTNLNKNEVIHLPLYSLLNGYYINKTGLFTITVEYLVSTPFEIGMWTSILSIAMLSILAVVIETKSIVKNWRKCLMITNRRHIHETVRPLV